MGLTRVADAKAAVESAQEDVRIAQKYVNGEVLSDEEQKAFIKSVALTGNILEPERLRQEMEAKTQLQKSVRDLEIAEASARESQAELEKQFALAMKGKIDQCFLVTVIGGENCPTKKLPLCQVN